MTVTSPRVWVGCLGCYNTGHLVGDWFDAESAPEDATIWGRHVTIYMPVSHFTESHEELWVFDNENFHGLLRADECSPVTAKRLAELIAAVESDDYPVEAVAAWVDYTGTELGEWDSPTREAFEDAYCGEYESEADYARELAEDLGAIPREYSWPVSYIDWESATRDLFASDYWSAPSPNGGVYVFRSE